MWRSFGTVKGRRHDRYVLWVETNNRKRFIDNSGRMSFKNWTIIKWEWSTLWGNQKYNSWIFKSELEVIKHIIYFSDYESKLYRKLRWEFDWVCGNQYMGKYSHKYLGKCNNLLFIQNLLKIRFFWCFSKFLSGNIFHVSEKNVLYHSFKVDWLPITSLYFLHHRMSLFHLHFKIFCDTQKSSLALPVNTLKCYALQSDLHNLINNYCISNHFSHDFFSDCIQGFLIFSRLIFFPETLYASICFNIFILL